MNGDRSKTASPADDTGGGTPPLREHRGWHTPRGLPHFDSPEVPQFITFRLRDSLPEDVARARADETDASYRRRIEAALDGGHGSCVLRHPEAAEIVCGALRYGHEAAYDLHAWVVMPNHVHVLIVQREGHLLADILHAWKGFSAKRINALLCRDGALWQRDYFEPFIRDSEHFDRVRAYIAHNPVHAGLAAKPEAWPYSNATGRSGDLGGETPPLL